MLTDVIFDGNNMAHRACFLKATPQMHEDVNVNYIRQFIRMILATLRKIENVGDVYVAWDKRLNKQATNFRKQLIGSVYKQNRDHSKSDHIFAMIDMIMPILASMGIRNVFPYSLEGDDVMAWLALRHCKKSIIVTADEDLWQLVGPTVSVFNPAKGLITSDNFTQFSPVPVDKYVLWKCILGDGSDFVKGLDGYGKKKAPILAMQFDQASLDPEQTAVIELNKQLLDLRHAIDVSEADQRAFESQIAFHTANTKFCRDKYCQRVIEIGLADMASGKTLMDIEAMYKSKTLLAAMDLSHLLATL